MLRPKEFLAAAREAATAADDKKALDILLLDVRHLPLVADYYLIATVESSAQLAAVRDNVARCVRDRCGLSPLRKDGRGSDHWVVLDFGGMVVHAMHRSAREFFGLERLWEGARPVDWRAPEAAPPKKKTTRKTGTAR